MKRTPLTDKDIQFYTMEAKAFTDWLTAMLYITLQSCGAKSRPYRQTLRLIRIMAEWQAAMSETKPISAIPGIASDPTLARHAGMPANIRRKVQLISEVSS